MSNSDTATEELLKKANQPAIDAMIMHPYYQGKIETAIKCCISSFDDFAIWYTPGVAAPCKDIQARPDAVFGHTNKGNTVAIVSDGTRVLGLGNIGPEAALPVMEGKAILFKYLGGVDAVPLCLNVHGEEELILTIRRLAPSFGGINLEDIEKPKCFRILRRLRQSMTIPVWHDDQQGTAAVTVAGFINATKVVGKALDKMKIALLGAGASNVRIAHLLIRAGCAPGNLILSDTRGTLHRGRKDLQSDPDHEEKWDLCRLTNERDLAGQIWDAMKGADALIALSSPGPGKVKKEWIAAMAKDPIVFVCANPVPEIWPWEAKEAGARIIATGRSDFPNQVNNSLGFPGIFRGALDVHAKTITDEMCLAAALELAKTAEDKGLSEEYIIPAMSQWEVFPREAAAVGRKAIEQGVARTEHSYQELLKMAEDRIHRVRENMRVRTENGLIKPRPI